MNGVSIDSVRIYPELESPAQLARYLLILKIVRERMTCLILK